MSRTFSSRRAVLTASPYALAAMLVIPTLASAREETRLNSNNRDTIRKWYEGWKKKDWPPLDRLLTDDFTFTSAAGDDHISKATFKSRCWESQIDFIGQIDLRHVFVHGNEAFVMYVCQTKNGKGFRNVEYLRLREDKIQAIECYFGAQSSFPSAVSTAER
jgi:ketosteroid isomerase-like protein